METAGHTAAALVRKATESAPERPGFWSKVGDFLGDVGDGLVDGGKTVVNDLASFGNAMIQHPGDSAAMLGGMLLAGVSAGGEGLGVALDAIHARFSPAYGPASGNTGWYAMDIEFKFDDEADPTRPATLYVKQARPYPDPFPDE